MKQNIQELAIFGGLPAFGNKLYVGRPNLGDRQRLLERINDILDSKWFSNNGQFVSEFEQRIADRLGVKHCIATCNATLGLEIAIKACGLSGEVIVPAFTFIATAHALEWQNITPVFCDIDSHTHNIDPSVVEKLITPRTTGIMGVHLWGRGCNVEALTEIANRHNLKLIFDAAHAFGCSYRGKTIGGFGDVEVFSFHATKFCNSFEGGAIATNNSQLASKIRLMKNFGFADYDCVASVGTNGKMTEVSAAMGLTSLESIEEFIATNYENYKYYQQELADIPGISLVTYDESEKSNYQYIVVEIDEDVTQISRDKIQEILWAENILARRYFYPGCHQMEPYRSQNRHRDLSLPNTNLLASKVLVLPTGTSVTATEITNICQLLRLVVSQSHQIQGELFYQNAQPTYVQPTFTSDRKEYQSQHISCYLQP
jgi:dTDP-4-amino-4,6-dideoxygalactose transaminase